MMEPFSYHDVAVFCGNIKHRITENYAYRLECSRTTGWQLLWIWQGEEKLLGEEYGTEPFCIDVGGLTILGKIPHNWKSAEQMGGWSGAVGETNG